MEHYSWLIIFILINIVIAWTAKKLLGLKLFEALPKYQSSWKNTFAAMLPALLFMLSCLITYSMYLVF